VLTARGGDADVSLVDVVRVTYPRKYRAEGDALRFPVPAGKSVTVEGFSDASIRAIDVTDPSRPVELMGTVGAADGASGFSLTLSMPGGAREVFAFTASQIATPTSISARPRPIDNSPADLIVVANAAFMNAMGPLVERRRRDGLSVALVDAESIYDAHGFGHKTPFALRQFLADAKASRGTKWALLVGDASVDPRNRLGRGASDLVPTKLVETHFLETASDDWLVDFDQNGHPDLALGRLPVRTEAEAAAVVAKLVSHRVPGTPIPLVVVSGKTNESDFNPDGKRLLAGFPAATERTHVSTDELGPAGAKDVLFSFLQKQSGVVQYFGHGAVELWANGLLDNADGELLAATRPSVFVPLTCLNGFFHDVYTESLAETLLKIPDGGALAVWASSGLTFASEQAVVGHAFTQSLLVGGTTLGEAAIAAKAAASLDVRKTWTLLGDPSMRVSIQQDPDVPGSPGSPSGSDSGGQSGCSCRIDARSAFAGLPIAVVVGIFLTLRNVRQRRRRLSQPRPPV
jgi:hypothetical protein